jgi:alpha-beta hydrolase superfamily lysophospholipase
MTLARQDAVLTWKEPSPVPLRGTLFLFPGRGESPQVYERFGRRLAADAYRVHAVTAPTESAEAALDQVTALLSADDSGTPRILVGSDAGAAYAAYLAAHSQLTGVSALILAGLPTATAQATPATWDEELDIRTACPTHRGRIAEDGVRHAALFSDLPETWLDASIAEQIDVPVLGIHGEADALSPLDAAHQWYAGVPVAELVRITGGRHDALNDQTHRTVAATIVLFLERLRLGSELRAIASSEDLRSTVGARS